MTSEIPKGYLTWEQRAYELQRLQELAECGDCDGGGEVFEEAKEAAIQRAKDEIENDSGKSVPKQ